MKCNKLFFVVTFLGFYFSDAQTVRNIEKQSLVWTRYLAQVELNKKWTIVAEIDERFFLKPVQQNLIVFRFQGRYKLKENIEYGGGFAYFSVTAQSPTDNFGYQVPEYRLQQDFTMKQQLGRFGFSQRYQFEQRFIDKYNDAGNYLKNEFYLRYRFKILSDFAIWKAENKFLNAIVYNEIMLNGGRNVVNNVFDQNRVYTALQYGFNDNFSVELGYLNSYQKRAGGIDFYNRNIIRFSVYHKL